jgi:hypothetical protein
MAQRICGLTEAISNIYFAWLDEVENRDGCCGRKKNTEHWRVSVSSEDSNLLGFNGQEISANGELQLVSYMFI